MINTDSLWISDLSRPRFDRLYGNVKTDVLIIGGGLAGLLCAYKLKVAGCDCLLVEANEICGGTTKNTTAKLTLQHGLIYDRLIKNSGFEKAQMYLHSQKLALEEYEKLCRGIDCDFERKDSYVYSVLDRGKIETEVSALQSIGGDCDLTDNLSLPIKIAGAIRVKDQAQFHPLKFAYAISRGLPICENTKVTHLSRGKAVTEHGEIKCDKIIIATHFPMLNKHGGYFLKLYQHRSYVIALDGASDVGGMFVDEDELGLSFRNYGGYLLIGGGAHRTGKDGDGWEEPQNFARWHYPSAKEVYRWAAQDCMSLDGVPYIGRYSKHTPDVYVATGFNKWGMSSSMVSAMLLCDMINGKQSDMAELYAPSRSVLCSQLAVNAIESLVGLLTPTVPRCPHLGCALIYNRAEHSWDCPCHGSRFDENGSLIDNPATEDLKNMR